VPTSKFSKSAHPQHGLSAADIARLDTWLLDIAEQLRGQFHPDTDGFRSGNRALLIHHNCCWFDFTADAGNHGALSLLAHLHRDDWQAAIEFAKNWLANHSGEGRLGRVDGDNEELDAEATEADDVQRTAYIETLWRCAEGDKNGTPAKAYLESRGTWPVPAEADKVLRWLPTAHGGMLVAAITDDAGALVAIQQTRITPEGEKSKLQPVRMTISGCHDWRSRGAFRLGAPTPDLVLTEGVEDALSAFAAGAACVHASLGVGALGCAELPPVTETVIVARDDDPPGSPACAALGRGVARLLGQKRKVLVTPRAGRFLPGAKDINDLLRADIELARRQLKEAGGLEAFDKVEREAVLDGISRLPDDEYNSHRAAIAKAVGWPTAELTRDRRKRRAERATQGNGDNDDDATKGAANAAAPPWRDPVTDLGGVLNAGVKELKRFVVVPDDTYYDTIALWCTVAHFIHVETSGIEYTARLAFQSPIKRCGKSTALKCSFLLSANSRMASSITSSALFRAIDAHRISLFVDEADNVFNDKPSELLGIINSGADRMTAKVMRSTPRENGEFDEREFNTFAPIALTSIDPLPDTLQDRSIVLALKRAKKGERPERLTLRTRGPLIDIGRQLARFAADFKAALPDMHLPADLFNRVEDCWTTLFQIAQLAGGDWPERCRKAALADVARLEADDADGGRNADLLADIWEVFYVGCEERMGANDGRNRMLTTTLCNALTDMSESPWGKVNRGKPVDGYYLRTHLADFIPPNAEDIAARKWYVQGNKTQLRGYDEAHFEDAFMRYLGKPLPSVTPKTSSGKNTHARGGSKPSASSAYPPQNAKPADIPDTYPEADVEADASQHPPAPPPSPPSGRTEADASRMAANPSAAQKSEQKEPSPGDQGGWADEADTLGGVRACVSDGQKAARRPDLPRGAFGGRRRGWPPRAEG
jgi:hypothetical protein